jgi:hypothetical protein
MMAVHTQLMQTITNVLLRNNNRVPNRNHTEGFQKKVENFNKLQLPTFNNSVDPMDPYDWLREIEKKLELTELTEEECVAVVTHQLIGTASAWWDSYYYSPRDPIHIRWNEFVEAFMDYDILEAVMD